MPSESTSKKVFGNEVVKSLVVGATSGTIATFVTFPTFVLKTRAQFGGGLTWRPSVLFRGSVPMAGTTAGILGLNVLANDSILRHCYGTKTPNFQQSLISSSVAGAWVAPIVSLLEFSITLQQKVPIQKKAQNSFATLYKFLNKHGAERAFIGMPAAVVRNTFISASFLSFTPFFKKKLLPVIKNDFSASTTAGIMTGFFTSIVAYPLDTLKTKQQANADSISVRHLALRRLVQEVVQTKGVRGLYAGSFWYFVGLSSYIASLAYLNEKLMKIFSKDPPSSGASQKAKEAESHAVENKASMRTRNQCEFFALPNQKEKFKQAIENAGSATRQFFYRSNF